MSSDSDRDKEILVQEFRYAAAENYLPSPDPAEYREYLDDFEISEQQKVELLQVLWSIMVSFVDMHLGVDSVQQCLPALQEFALEPDSGELEQTRNQLPFNDTDMFSAEKED